MRRTRPPQLGAEPLERRQLLTVAAFVDTFSGALVVQMGEDGDQATLTAAESVVGTGPTQRVYQVTGTGLTQAVQIPAAGLTAIQVSGAPGRQEFTVADAASLAVEAALNVDGDVERAAIYGRVDAAGIVLVKAAETVLGSSVRSSGEQVYQEQVLLDGDVAIDAGTAKVSFLAAIDGIGAGRFQRGETGALEVRTAAETFFGGPLGGRLGLAGLHTDAAGTTLFAGGVVVTDGPLGQRFGDPVTFVGNTVAATNVLLQAGGGPIGFEAAVNGGVSIVMTTAGSVELRGPVGTATPLLSLAADAAGTTTLGGGTLAASSLEFKHAVALAARTSLTVDKLRFGGTVDGGYPLDIDARAGEVEFLAAVGGKTPLAGLAIRSAGSIAASVPITLDGAASGATSDGLVIGAGVDDALLSGGGSIRNFPGAGLVFAGGSTASEISGFAIRANGDGILVQAGDYTGTAIAGNTVLGNGSKSAAGDGIRVLGSNIIIGGTVGNVISGNAGRGVVVGVAAASGNAILGNAIYANGGGPPAPSGAGIRLENGGNATAARPTIDAVAIDPVAAVTRVRVSIPAANGRTFRVQLFANPPSDAAGTTPVDPVVFQGRTLVADQTVVGGGPVIIEIPLPAVAAGDWLTATATGPDGSTSAFSAGVEVAAQQQAATSVTGPAAGRYTTGDVLEFAVTFAVSVDVTGAPYLPVAIGNAARQAVYAGGTGTTRLLFRAIVQADDAGAVSAGTALALDGGSIREDLGIQVSTVLPPVNTADVFVENRIEVVFAAATAGSSTAWEREYVYRAAAARSIVVPAASAAQAGFFAAGMRLTITPAGWGESRAVTIARSVYSAGRRNVTLTLREAIPTTPGTGTLVLGDAATPGARLVEAVSGESQREFGAADLLAAGYSNAFVTRFQGGLRVAAADANDDGRAELVAAPGGVPDRPDPMAPNRTLARAFGTSLTTVAIFDGPISAAWDPVAIDVAPVFSGDIRGGFFVTLCDCVADSAGSGRRELVVAAGGRVVVFDVLVGEPGARPMIEPLPVRVIDLPAGQTITSIAAGRLLDPEGLEDIVLAATTAAVRTAGTTTVTILAGVTFEPGRSFVASSLVESGPSRRLVNVFGFGAAVGVGDIDGDQRADLVIGAGANGLANFRVLGNEFVSAESAVTNPAAFAAAIGEQLGPRGRFAQAPRQGQRWRPTGGPDFFTPGEVIGPTGMGFNAPLSLVVVNGLPAANGRAQIFAALGGANQTANTVRRFLFAGPNAWTSDAAFDLLPRTVGNRQFRYGGGLTLG